MSNDVTTTAEHTNRLATFSCGKGETNKGKKNTVIYRQLRIQKQTTEYKQQRSGNSNQKKTRQRETRCSAREQICSHNKLDRTMSMQRIQEKYYLLPSGNGSSNSSSSWPLFLLLLQL
jgi:hypothetical protein